MPNGVSRRPIATAALGVDDNGQPDGVDGQYTHLDQLFQLAEAAHDDLVGDSVGAKPSGRIIEETMRGAAAVLK